MIEALAQSTVGAYFKPFKLLNSQSGFQHMASVFNYNFSGVHFLVSMNNALDSWQSVFLSKFSRGYEARRFSLQENETRRGRGTDDNFFPSGFLLYSAILLFNCLLRRNARRKVC